VRRAPDPDWMTVDELAALVSVSRDAAYRQIRETGRVAGEIPAVRIGRSVRLPRARVMAWRDEMLELSRPAEPPSTAPASSSAASEGVPSTEVPVGPQADERFSGGSW
jgi:excisionase family DNA binding protein